MMAVQVFLSLVTVCSFMIQQTDQCNLETGNGNGLPSFTDYRNKEDRIQISLHQQAIIQSYEFMCCGEIREWGVDVHPGGGNDNMQYTLDFQVWRPSPTLGNGYYNLVGNNKFTSITLRNDQVAVVTPSAGDYIQFQSRDVLGVYVEEAMGDNNRGVVVLTNPSSFTSESVWYASIAPTMAASQIVAGCPISVGSGGDLNTLLRGAPVISISTVTSSCPQPLPTPPPCKSTTAQPTTEQPTPPQPTTEEPTVSAEAPEPTLIAREPITSEPVASSTTNMVPDSSTPDKNTLPTDSAPGEVVSIDDRESGGGGSPVSVIAAVVLAILVAIILTVLISVLVAVVVSKKRSKKTFNVTHTNLRVGITNTLYGQNPSLNDPTYDYVDEKFPVVVFSGSLETTYHEAVLYHSTGPSASKAHGTPGVSERAGVHIYDDASVQLLPAGSTTSSGHPVYEDPTLSQVYYSRNGTESTHDDVAIVNIYKRKGLF